MQLFCITSPLLKEIVIPSLLFLKNHMVFFNKKAKPYSTYIPCALRKEGGRGDLPIVEHEIHNLTRPNLTYKPLRELNVNCLVQKN